MGQQGWSRWHHRLHRHLLDQPALLPAQARLLVAVSGGQDSMALLRLLLDLRHLHHWTLHLWHGDHGWHGGSGTIASELAAWCQDQDQPLIIDRAEAEEARSENAARNWRYDALLRHCRDLGCDAVTGHTASDRAETMLINLARGSDLAGLSSLPSLRPLDANQPEGPHLRRPLLLFSRPETAEACQELELPIWIDPSNASEDYSRNRVRQRVLPVLEELHPGCSQRMAATAERLSHQKQSRHELIGLALQQLGTAAGLDRSGLKRLSDTTRQMLLASWLLEHNVPALTGEQLRGLSQRIAANDGKGETNLRSGWTLSWDQTLVALKRSAAQDCM